MGLNKNSKLMISYIFLMFLVYNFSLVFFSHINKYSSCFLFIVFIFVEYIFGQIEFESSRFRLQDVFTNFLINFVFATFIFVFLKEINIFGIFTLIFLFQVLFRFFGTFRNIKKKNVLIFGSNHIKDKIQKDIENSLDFEYIGYLSSDICKESAKDFLGKYDVLKEIIKEKNIDVLIIAEDMRTEIFEQYLKRMAILKVNGLQIMTYQHFNENIQKKIDIHSLNEKWFIETEGFDILDDKKQKNIKRGTDILFSLILLFLTLPFFPLIAIIIKIESSGPVIFSQIRIGKNMKKFKIYKFRSMKVHDLEEYSKYAVEKDERITKFGKFMRKMRIDELPQLYCILKGDMSFAGPRPEWDLLVEKYEKEIPYYNLRHIIKPGITGWAQVMYSYGENLEDAKRKLEYDIYYLRHQSFILDILILMKTIKVILFKRGK